MINVQEFTITNKHTTDEIIKLLENHDIETDSFEDTKFVVPENQISEALDILSSHGYEIRL